MSQTWTFERGDERLILHRQADDEQHMLVITGKDGCSAVPFSDLEALVCFQEDMERMLLSTGWSLSIFAPERRRYNDRRSFPRIENDRRRWWTDASERLKETK